MKILKKFLCTVLFSVCTLLVYGQTEIAKEETAPWKTIVTLVVLVAIVVAGSKYLPNPEEALGHGNGSELHKPPWLKKVTKEQLLDLDANDYLLTTVGAWKVVKKPISFKNGDICIMVVPPGGGEVMQVIWQNGLFTNAIDEVIHELSYEFEGFSCHGNSIG